MKYDLVVTFRDEAVTVEADSFDEAKWIVYTMIEEGEIEPIPLLVKGGDDGEVSN